MPPGLVQAGPELGVGGGKGSEHSGVVGLGGETDFGAPLLSGSGDYSICEMGVGTHLRGCWRMRCVVFTVSGMVQRLGWEGKRWS